MTICLALLCDGGKQVVAVADRMVSIDVLSLEYEQRTKKLVRLGDRVVAMAAGNELAHADLLGQVRQKVQDGTRMTVAEVAALVETGFIEARQRLAERTVLNPAGLTFETLLANQERLPSLYAQTLLSQYRNVELELEILIVGVDGSGGHLYGIGDPGLRLCFDSVGYAAIGSGLPQAMASLAEAARVSELTLERALWLSYVAKRRSETAPGVGKATDILVVNADDGVRPVDEETVAALGDIYQGYLAKLCALSDENDTAVSAVRPVFDKHG